MQDALMAFFSAVGMAAVVWLAAGLVFRPGRQGVPGVRLVLPLEGDAPAMEQDVRTLNRIRAQLPGALLVLEDRGMTLEARALARYLAEQDDFAVLITKERGPQDP